MKSKMRFHSLLVVFGSALFSFAVAQETAKPKPPTAAAEAEKSEKKEGKSKQDNTPYFVSSQVDWVPLLPPPPAANSPEQQRDVQAVLDIQAANRKGERRERAIKDVEASCSRVADVLSVQIDDKTLPRTAAFLQKAAEEGDSAAGIVKNRWKRPRPYVVSNKVERLGDMDPEYLKKKQQEQKEKEQKEKDSKAKDSKTDDKAGGNTPPPPDDEGPPRRPPPGDGPPRRPGAEPNDDGKKKNPEEEKKKLADQQKKVDYSSYPSGHSTYGTLCAIFLTEMVPEKQAELFARAEEYRQSRMIVGAHFRTDIEGGRALATAVAAVISQNFGFQRDLAAARAELRAALGLPAELPAPPANDDEKEEKKKE